MRGGDELFLRRRVDAVVTGPGDGRRAQAEMDLACSRRANHLHQAFAGRAPHERVVHHDDGPALDDFANRIELDLHLGHAQRLGRIDERPADVMVPDQSVFQLETGRLREAQRHGVARIRDAEDDVRAGRGLLDGELAAELPPGAVHRLPEDPTVGAGEVDELEHAAAHRLGSERRERLDHAAGDAHEFAGLQLAHHRGAHQVERARLRGDHDAVAQTPEDQRAKAPRIDHGVQRPAHADHQAEGAIDPGERLADLLLGVLAPRARDQVNDDFRIRG